MKKIASCALLVGATGIFCLQVLAQEVPAELRPSVPAGAVSGQAKLTVWGFAVYQATLWVVPGFAESRYEQSPFALELAYLRDFKGADIAKRSIAEMRRQASMTPAQEAVWESQMRALFPDVQSGERITGVNQPGSGAVFWSNGRLLGEVRDPAFAKQFFGIWLSPQTSEPQMRRALLAQAKPSTLAGATP
jgi:hypothetical protein